MTTVAVTGASGFLGRHTVAELEAHGYDVVPLGRGDTGDLVRTSGSQRGDTAVYSGIDAIVHLAGQLALGPTATLADYLAPNVALTESVLLDAADAGAGIFVFASSRLVYPSHLGRPAREVDVAPDSAYGLSKWFAEMTVRFQADRHGLSATSLRFSQLFGDGDGGRGALARFVDAARKGRPVEVYGAGRAVRDFLPVSDAARAIRLAIEGRPEAPALNIGGGGHSILELAEVAIVAAGGDPASIVHLPTDHEDQSHWSLDCELAREQLGWTPRQTLADAVR